MVDVMPFAQALYEVAAESKKDVLFQEQLKDLSEVWTTNLDLVRVLKHPKIKKKEKEELLRTLVSDDMDEMLWRFVRVLVSHEAAAYIPEIYRSYGQCFNRAHGIECVDVESASTLSQQQLNDLKRVLERKLKKTIELRVKPDPSLIAGIRVRTDAFVLDNTVVAKAEAMKEQIKKS